MLDTQAKKLPPMLRALRILEECARAGQPITGAELGRSLDLPKQTIHRITGQLEETGYLLRDIDSKRFVPGPRLRSLATDVHLNESTGASRHAVLQSLAREIGETCNCTILDRNELMYFDRVETNWPHRIQLPVGSRHPLHCTASGKLLLAFMPRHKRERLLSVTSLERFTNRTITDSSVLAERLAEVREKGVGEDNEEYLEGMAAIAVPIVDHNNRVGVSLAVHAPTSRKPIDELRQYLPAMRRAAASIARLQSDVASH